jgi:hypothetical protein
MAKPPFETIKFVIIPLGTSVEFPAYINTIASRFAPSWTDFPEIGRADAKVLLSSFAKDVDINFTVVAENNVDADVSTMFDKLQDLSRATMPHYFSGNKGFQGNFLQFTIGKIYVDEIGYVSSLDYQWENDKTSFIEDLPMLTTVNMTIRWVGKRMPSDTNDIFSHRT